RLYGRSGFYQYQCVVPRAVQSDAIAALVGEIARAGQASALAVIKQFGEHVSPGLLSFPMPGTHIALDFPNRGAPIHALFERLDAIIAAAGGRLYPAKDGRMPAGLFQNGYPRWREINALKDPQVRSDFWDRVSR
ncbi:MAG: FAD-binding protein, partial [Stellaceae bacterium]